MRTLGDHERPPAKDRAKPTRIPGPSAVSASFQPTKSRFAGSTATYGSTWKRNGVDPSVTRMWGSKKPPGGAAPTAAPHVAATRRVVAHAAAPVKQELSNRPTGTPPPTRTGTAFMGI